MTQRLLGGLSPRDFLRRHWQKRPLFTRGALPQLEAMPDRQALAALAARDDVESRIVRRNGRRWETAHGPFGQVSLGARNSSLLVSGVNLHAPAADRLLRRFGFLPQARLDDVMISYATTGGGVGPHIDSYDVFLIQGEGMRKWTVWSPDRSTKKSYLSTPGDLLYLPPGWKHDGVALEPCTTYSIGFRAPRGAELGAAFLDYLHERGLPDSRYRDPGLAATGSSGSIPAGMVDFTENVLGKIRWSRSDAVRLLGEYLTQPKPHVVFKPTATRGAMVRLDPKTQLLYCGETFFINGESLSVPLRQRHALRRLADRRAGPAANLAGLANLIGEWRRAGYVHLGKHDG